MTEEQQKDLIGLSVSLHCASQINMFPQLQELEKLAFDWYHIDITDGVFAPNYALGTRLVQELKGYVTKPLHVHLMAVQPEQQLQALYEAGASGFSFHLETTNFPFRLIGAIHSRGMHAGVIITPSVPVEGLANLIEAVDSVTVMSIEPGISGQTFMEFSYEKISSLRNMITASNSKAVIEVDGGVDVSIAKRCMELGADSVVGGFYTIFREGRSITENYRELIGSIMG